MMKKLLVLALVLAAASLANAGLSIQLDGNPTTVDVITIQPSTDVTIGVMAMLEGKAPDELWMEIAGMGEWLRGTVILGPAAGSGGAQVSDGGEFGGPAWVYLAYPTPPAPGTWSDGIQMSMKFHCTGPADVVIKLYDPSGVTVVDTAIIHQIPEPITMVLLGLGGLFLRKKK